MGKRCEVAGDTLDDFITNKDSFTHGSLLDTIKERGGIFRIAPAMTVKMYLSELVDSGVLLYRPRDQVYTVLSKTYL